jgi:hypothetical protein
MAIILLGSTSPRSAPAGTSVSVNGPDETPPEALPKGKSIVLIDTPSDGKLSRQLQEIHNAFRIHSHTDAVWVEGHDDYLTEAVSREYGCKVGRPDDWDAPESAEEPSSDESSDQDQETPDHEAPEA